MTSKKWFGKWPAKCDICAIPLTPRYHKYFVDGRIQSGRWALMCPICHLINGVGLGTGRGQKYDIETLEKLEG